MVKKIFYSAKHILLEDLEDANEILNMIKEGKPFEDLAMDFSECDSGARGGDLGRFASGAMVPEFERALFNMKVGDFSNPVKTKFGFHIIWRIE